MHGARRAPCNSIKVNRRSYGAIRTAYEVCVLVPGQLMSAPFPNYINLETESAESSWHTIRQIWMPEDERFEYLVLKFPKD
jgi:hypothetical protein